MLRTGFLGEGLRRARRSLIGWLGRQVGRQVRLRGRDGERLGRRVAGVGFGFLSVGRRDFDHPLESPQSVIFLQEPQGGDPLTNLMVERFQAPQRGFQVRWHEMGHR